METKANPPAAHFTPPEPAARSGAEAAARGRHDGGRLRQPHQPVLSPRQRGGGAQPQEGDVSGGVAHTKFTRLKKNPTNTGPPWQPPCVCVIKVLLEWN